jgi:hypothetical protein
MKKEKRRWKPLFYALVIAFAVVSFWRGIWGLMDLYLFPNNFALSFWISTILGVIILYSIKHKFDSLI